MLTVLEHIKENDRSRHPFLLYFRLILKAYKSYKIIFLINY